MTEEQATSYVKKVSDSCYVFWEGVYVCVCVCEWIYYGDGWVEEEEERV